MKFRCECGAVIVDQTDELPYKAHILPDQKLGVLFSTIDAALDVQRGPTPDENDKYWLQITDSMITAYQCNACGRIFIDGPNNTFNVYKPEGDSSKNIFVPKPPPDMFA